MPKFVSLATGEEIGLSEKNPLTRIGPCHCYIEAAQMSPRQWRKAFRSNNEGGEYTVPYPQSSLIKYIEGRGDKDIRCLAPTLYTLMHCIGVGGPSFNDLAIVLTGEREISNVEETLYCLCLGGTSPGFFLEKSGNLLGEFAGIAFPWGLHNHPITTEMKTKWTQPNAISVLFAFRNNNYHEYLEPSPSKPLLRVERLGTDTVRISIVPDISLDERVVRFLMACVTIAAYSNTSTTAPAKWRDEVHGAHEGWMIWLNEQIGAKLVERARNKEIDMIRKGLKLFASGICRSAEKCRQDGEFPTIAQTQERAKRLLEIAQQSGDSLAGALGTTGIGFASADGTT